MSLIDTDAKNIPILPMNNLSLTYNYTHDKLNFYTKIRNRYNDFNLPGIMHKEYNSGLSVQNSPIDDNANIRVQTLSNSYTTGLDYYINPKHTVSFESYIQAFPPRTNSEQHKFDVSQYQDNILTNNYISELTNNSKTQNFSNSLFYLYNINKNNSLNANFT